MVKPLYIVGALLLSSAAAMAQSGQGTPMASSPDFGKTTLPTTTNPTAAVPPAGGSATRDVSQHRHAHHHKSNTDTSDGSGSNPQP